MTERTRAYRRHQRQRAYARARRLVYVLWDLRDCPYADELVHMYATDRAVVGSNAWRSHYNTLRPRDQRRADDARNQLTEIA